MALIPTVSIVKNIEIKKSKFIGIGYPIKDVEEARNILSGLRKEYMDARHVCYAFLWGRKSTHMGMSDDGEPHGTAGLPMLEVLKGSGYENILVAVIRSFGGVKLGTGGLVKAYTEITQEVIKNIPVEIYTEKVLLELVVPYALYNQTKIILDEFNAAVIDEIFLTEIKLNFFIAKTYENLLANRIQDISNGSIFIIKN